MAAAEYSLQELCEELTCSICLDYFTDPVTINCGHNFCHVCLKDYWEDKESSCPLCREKVQHTQFNPNKQLANFVEISKKLRDEGKKRAEGNDGVCEKHQEPLKLFCKEDQSLICAECDKSKEHQNPTVVPVKEAAQEYQEQIYSYLEILKKEREDTLASKAVAEKESQDLLKQTKTEKKTTVAEFRKLHQFLETEEKLLLSQIEEMEKEIAKKRKEHLSRISNELSSLESFIQEVERKCQQPASELLQDIKGTLERIKGRSASKNPMFFSPELELKIFEFCDMNLFLKRLMKQLKDAFLSRPPLQKANVTLDQDAAYSKPQQIFLLGHEEFTANKHFREVSVGEKGAWNMGIARKSVPFQLGTMQSVPSSLSRPTLSTINISATVSGVSDQEDEATQWAKTGSTSKKCLALDKEGELWVPEMYMAPEEEENSPIARRLRNGVKTQNAISLLPDKPTGVSPLQQVTHMVPNQDDQAQELYAPIQAYTYTPFTTSDLLNWKTYYASYTENPQELVQLCASIMASHFPNWSDCQQLLLTLFTSEERRRIIQHAERIALARAPKNHVDAQGWMRERVPLVDPHWDPNLVEHRERLIKYQTLLIEAMRAGMKKPINMTKVSEVLQGATESPGAYLERLLDAFRQYTPLDPEAPDNMQIVKMAFVSQSCPDIRRKLQKLKGFAEKNMAELLEVARKVYVNRDVEEKREKGRRMAKKAELFAAALAEQWGRGRGQGQGWGRGDARRPGRGRRSLGRNQCARCGQEGHWQRDCPIRNHLMEGEERQRSQSGRAHQLGQTGHPQPWPRGAHGHRHCGGQDIDFMVDTGAAASIVTYPVAPSPTKRYE